MTAPNIKVQQSRFALLKVEDDEDEVETKASQTQGGKNNQQQAKSKNKKRKKKPTQDDELKNMAFGLSCHGTANQRPQSAQTQSSENGRGNKGGKKNKEAKPELWEEWKKIDDQLTKDFYEKDLQEALLLSKMEFEHHKGKGDGKSSSKNADQTSDGKDGRKKSGKKDKPVTMSLEEFNSNSTKSTYDELEDLPKLSPGSHKVEAPNSIPADVKFFDTVDDDVHKILQKEKIQDEYQKQYAVESVMSNKYKTALNKKDKEIEFLRATVSKLEGEFKQVKKRNKQLYVILAEGEMKDKAEVLMQVNQLAEVRDELTEQVTSLSAELEKERSKVHALKAEVDKQKGGKHAGK